VPEHEPEFVLEEPREHPSVPLPMSWPNSASAGIALDKLSALFGLRRFISLDLVGKLVIAALRADFAGLRPL